MSGTLELENVYQAILDKIIILKNDIITSLQDKVSHETVQHIIQSLNQFYCEIMYQMNNFRMEANAISTGNTEDNR